MNWELPDVQAGFRKDRGTRDQIANIHWIVEKTRDFQRNICFIDYTKAVDCVGHNKLWKILKEMGIPGQLTCLLRNLYVGQEVIEPDMEQQTGSKLGKEYDWTITTTMYVKCLICARHNSVRCIFSPVFNPHNSPGDFFSIWGN